MPRADHARREEVRLRAAGMFAEGRSQASVAAELRVSIRSVWKWHKQWAEGGPEALRSRGRTGARSLLDADQLQRLGGELDRGALAHGFPDDRWTLGRVVKLVESLFGVSYTVPGMSALMHRIGFTPQVPARRADRRDEAAVRTWHRGRWQAVKGSR